jgi:UV DNA damage endonuclease
VRFRTITRKRLLQFDLAKQEELLRELYTENLRRLEVAIRFCDRQDIRLYRLSSALFPFADEPIGEAVLCTMVHKMKETGMLATALGIRLVLHPDQFVVLNSDRPEVIDNSIKILNMHARILDLLEQPRSPWALMNIHGGKGDRVQRLIEVIRNLPDNIRLRLTLENDEYAYSARRILEICQATDIPMVFDAHHHVIHEHLDSYEDASIPQMVADACTTWPDPEWQLVHISNGNASFGDPKHSDVITVMPSAYENVPWIEIEAKQKEIAIAKLCQEWAATL